MPDSGARRAALPGGVHLDYTEWGAPDGVPVVLVPGLGDSWRSFEPVLGLLPHRVRAVAVSQRGHGDSDRPTTGYATTDYVADLLGFLDATGIARGVLVGHSSSTIATRRFAERYPDRTAGLVMIGAPATIRGSSADEFYVSVLSRLTDPLPAGFLRDLTAATVARRPPGEFLAAMVAEQGKVPARVWRETFSGAMNDDALSGLDSITAPTLLVWGDADEIVGRAEQEALLARLRHGRLCVYRGVGHSPHWEDPVRFAVDLTDFATGLNR